jgi:hypothetical protein
MNPEAFNLAQFIRSCDDLKFHMEVVENQEGYLEMVIFPLNNPSNKFSVYIEKNIVFGKKVLDSFQEHFGKHLKKNKHKIATDELYKKMIGNIRDGN